MVCFHHIQCIILVRGCSIGSIFLHNTCINMLATRLHVHIYDVFMFRQSLHKVFQQPADGPEFPPGTTTPL